MNPNLATLNTYPLLDALRFRRSRRFGLGMEIPGGPLAFKSRFASRALSEAEEAALAFAACAPTGYALADLCYAAGHGGNIMAGLLARTVSSGDAIQSVALVVTNDAGTWFVKRPQDFGRDEIPELIALTRSNQLLDLYRRTRVKLSDTRTRVSCDPLFNLAVNRWSVHAPGTTYFLPISDLTFLYINGLLEIFSEHAGAFILDERRGFQPAGLGRFARSRGGHLCDDPKLGCVATTKQVEFMVTEFVTIEAGMLLQNLGLMAQALGLGGFPNFANHEFGWFEALGFRMATMRASRYLGAGRVVSAGMKMLGRDAAVPYAVGLERAGEILLKTYSPPYFRSMKDAVLAVVEAKTGAAGAFHSSNPNVAWKASETIAPNVPRVSDAAIEATIAYCEYLWGRYGRFPVHLPPFRTVAGFQAAHIDAEFYEQFYKPEALSATQWADFRSGTP